MEAIRLRVKDVELVRHEVLVREAKGGKDRVTMLPSVLVEPIRRQFAHVQAMHDADIRAGRGAVYLPFALERKYPHAASEWGWQYLFPSQHLSADPRSGIVRRHHLGKL